VQTLAEDILLLALDDDKGTVNWQRTTEVPYALGGALLMDLALSGRIDVSNNKVVVRDAGAVGDELLDSSLQTLSASKKDRDPKHWVRKLGERRGLKEDVARRLVQRGILREEEHQFLWVFHSSRFPTSDSRAEASLRDRVRSVALNGAEPNERTVLLLSLLSASKLSDGLFSRVERSQARRRIKELVAGERFGKAVSGAISDVIAAVVATTTAASVAATS
jgi:hypothetical protein